jgi:hypothetical protein
MRTFMAGGDDSKDDASQKEPKARGLEFDAVMNSDTIFERLSAFDSQDGCGRRRDGGHQPAAPGECGARAGATPLVADPLVAFVASGFSRTASGPDPLVSSGQADLN